MIGGNPTKRSIFRKLGTTNAITNPTWHFSARQPATVLHRLVVNLVTWRENLLYHVYIHAASLVQTRRKYSFKNIRVFHPSLCNGQTALHILRGHLHLIYYSLNSLHSFCPSSIQKSQEDNKWLKDKATPHCRGYYIVNCKVSQLQFLVPFKWVSFDVRPQEILQYPYHLLGLTINWRMKSHCGPKIIVSRSSQLVWIC